MYSVVNLFTILIFSYVRKNVNHIGLFVRKNDFLIQIETDIVPIEVKAEENLKAKSLRVYCDKFKPKTAIRTSMSNYREQDWMVNVPLYVLDKYVL